MDVTTQNAAPSAAETMEIPSGADYDRWRMSGELPQPKTAEPAPAKAAVEAPPKDSAAEVEDAEAEKAAPAPEAGKETPQDAPRKRSGAEDRIRQLLADNKRLKAALEQGAPQTRPAESSPATPSPAELKPPIKPKQENFSSYEEFDAARDKWVEELADYKSKQAVADFQRSERERAQSAALSLQMNEGRQKYADFDQTAAPVLQTLIADQNIPNEVKGLIAASPVLPHLLYVMGGDPANLKDFLDTAHTDPIGALRKVVLLEQLVMQEMQGPERDSAGKFTPKPAEKKITQAPPPPKEAGGRASPPADEVEAALDSDDPRNYIEAANRRDLANRRK